MTPEPEAAEVLRDLLGGQRLAVLATHGPEHPYASLVAFSTDDALTRLYFVTPRATRKFHFLTHDSAVSLLVDDRSAEDLDFHHAAAVTAVGAARELKGAERDEALRGFTARHPHLGSFAASPSSALVEIRVATYYVVRRFQNVTEIHLE